MTGRCVGFPPTHAGQISIRMGRNYKRKRDNLRKMADIGCTAATIIVVTRMTPKLNRILYRAGFGGINIDDVTAEELSKILAIFLAGMSIVIDTEEFIKNEKSRRANK